MSAVRDVPLTEYVRWLINRWEAEGKNLFDLEKAGGMSKGYASKVRNGDSGVSAKSGAGFARAFQLGTYADLIVAAHRWWAETGHALPQPEMLDTEKRKAIQIARVLGFPEDLPELTFLKYGAAGNGKDALWWVDRMQEESPAPPKVAAPKSTRLVGEHAAAPPKRNRHRSA